ncbi:MAG: DUF3576 domain-containing protein [Alphaproteobacteria bacterium]|nr:DUF3576 domain-containing protein [Alphaproteobacteria bacterium]
MAMSKFARIARVAAALGVAGLLLGACEVSDIAYDTPDKRTRRGQGKYDQSIFGEGGFNFFGLGNKDAGEGSGGGPGGISVNSYLWRASLDTIQFMPLASADPFGGVIITDWYAPPETPAERFKINVYILDRRLIADGVRAAVFKQRQDGPAWVDAPVNASTGTELENAILTRARQLRIATAK